MAEGLPGVGQTVQAMRQLIDEGSTEPVVVTEARKIVLPVQARDERAEVRSVFEWVRNHVRYTRDPWFAEAVTDAPTMIEKIQLEGVVAGDCDDASVLLGALLQAIGYPVELAIESFDGSGSPSHVLVKTWIHGRPIHLDATVPYLPMGMPAAIPTARYREHEIAKKGTPAMLGDPYAVAEPEGYDATLYDLQKMEIKPDIRETQPVEYGDDPFWDAQSTGEGFVTQFQAAPPEETFVFSASPGMAPAPTSTPTDTGGSAGGLAEELTGKNEQSAWDDFFSGFKDVADWALDTPIADAYISKLQAGAAKDIAETSQSLGADGMQAYYGALAAQNQQLAAMLQSGYQNQPAPSGPSPTPAPAPEKGGMPGWAWPAIIGGGVLLLAAGFAASR